MISLQKCENHEEWDDYVLENGGHPLQLWGWGDVKAAHGWTVERLIAYDTEHKKIGAVQILVKKLPKPFTSFSYVPRGPVTDRKHRVGLLNALTSYVKTHHRSVAVRIEPDWDDQQEVPEGWHKTKSTILIPHTLILDLKNSTDELQSAMSKKTRQYIRKSTSDTSFEIRQIKDREELEKCLNVYHQTAKRAGFALHNDNYYYDVFENFGDASPVFAAYKDGWPVAFLWLAISQSIAFELYGGMNEEGQMLRANYALKWHAITKMKEWGIERYDMNGLVSDGVSNFKKGFANHEDILIGTLEKPLSPLYFFWTHFLPLGKKIVRMTKR